MIVNMTPCKNIRISASIKLLTSPSFEMYNRIRTAHFKWIFVWIKHDKKNLCQFGYSYIHVWVSLVSYHLSVSKYGYSTLEDEESVLSWNVGQITHWHGVISQKFGILSYIAAKTSKLKVNHISSKLWVHICVSFLIAVLHK